MKRELGRKTLMISSAWLFTIAIAFWLGSHWASSRGGNSLSVVGEQDFEKAQETIERIVVIRRFSGETPTLDPAESFPPQVQHALTRALREAEPHRRGYAIDVILSGLVLNDIGEAVAFIGNLPLGARRDEMLERLLLRWGELDGRSALAFAFDLPSNIRNTGTLRPPYPPRLPAGPKVIRKAHGTGRWRIPEPVPFRVSALTP